MSKQLEQILDLLLNEQNEQAEQMFHDYMVGKARSEYQRQLDEEEAAEDDEQDEHKDEIEGEEKGLREEDEDEAEDEIESEEEGDEESDDEDLSDELDSEEEPEDGDDEDEDEDVEDRVDDLEDDLAQLQAEFDRLMSGEEGEDEFGDDMQDGDVIDQGGDFEDDVAADGYDDEEEFDMEDPALAEATKLSDKRPEQAMKGTKLKGSDADKEDGPFTKTPGKPGVKPGQPVKIDSKDGEKEVKNEKPKSSRYDGVDNRLKTVKPEQKSSKQPMKKGGSSED